MPALQGAEGGRLLEPIEGLGLRAPQDLHQFRASHAVAQRGGGLQNQPPDFALLGCHLGRIGRGQRRLVAAQLVLGRLARVAEVLQQVLPARGVGLAVPQHRAELVLAHRAAFGGAAVVLGGQPGIQRPCFGTVTLATLVQRDQTAHLFQQAEPVAGLDFAALAGCREPLHRLRSQRHGCQQAAEQRAREQVLLDEPLLQPDVGRVVQQDAPRRQPVAPGPARLLIIALDGRRHGVVDHKPHVRFVDPHPKAVVATAMESGAAMKASCPAVRCSSRRPAW